MPDFDALYNEPLQEAFKQGLRAEDGTKARMFEGLRADYVALLEYVATAEGQAETDRRLEEGLAELERATVADIESAHEDGREKVEDGHAESYAAAASAAAVSVPDWTPDASGVSPFEKAPFAGGGGGGGSGGASTTADFLGASIEEEVEYFKQDLKYIRKYVSEDEYAKAVAQTLARGDDWAKEALMRRGIDLDDIDTDALLGEAADVFQNAKTMGSPDIRGILKELDIDDIAERDPALYRRIKTNGTDSLSRLMDEVAKDLAVDSPAVSLVVWTLSTRHGSLPSSPDECDFLAGQDLYGFGPGYYHPKTVPSHPHPQCECSITAVTRDPSEWGEQGPERPEAFDVSEEGVREVLEEVASRMDVDGRTVTDRHVERVRETVEGVIAEVHQNPRE